jgi:hypothetical protein
MNKNERQSTGILDALGKQIYVDDIIHDMHYVGRDKRKHFYVVFEDNGKFAMKRIHDESITEFEHFTFTSEIVIGNIHDNPELLKMY